MSKKADAMMKQRLLDERARLLRQRDALENQICGLERAIELLDEPPDEESPQQGRGKLKTLVLDMLREVGTTGLNAATAMEMADRRGLVIAKDSVSSLLSRLKKDDVVQYDGEKYRLTEFSRSTNPRISFLNFEERARA